jgi:hypothetical protein
MKKQIRSPWAWALLGACISAVSYALQHQYDAKALSAGWFFEMAEYVALVAWAFAAIGFVRNAVWARRARRMKAKANLGVPAMEAVE